MCELGLLFGRKKSHLKFEIHVVMHLSQRRPPCQNINSKSHLSAGILATVAENRPEDLRFRVSHLPFRQLK